MGEKVITPYYFEKSDTISYNIIWGTNFKKFNIYHAPYF
jgi:hypothetical protein